jgi:hypothetical protein
LSLDLEGVVRSGPALVALLLAASFAAGKEIQDPAGDGNVQGVPLDYVDLLGAAANVDSLNLTATFRVADLDVPPTASLAPTTEYYLEFTYRGEVFHLVAQFVPGDIEGGAVDPDSQSKLYREFPSGSPPWTDLGTFPGAIDRAQGTISAAVPISVIQATDGFSPGPGENLQLLRAAAYFDEGPGSPHQNARGGAPGSPGALLGSPLLPGGDDAVYPADAILEIPGQLTGGLALSTPQRVRHSNGEATTYLWPIDISNRLDAEHDFTITATADAGTELRAPQVVRIEAKGNHTVDVFATVPFFHQHGGQRTIQVDVEGAGEQARMELVVRYLEVPQPAGHHPVIYLHRDNPGGGDPGRAWIDTNPEAEGTDAAMQFGAGGCHVNGETQPGMYLAMPLHPALLIGIDAKPNATATFTGTLDFAGPTLAGRLTARLVTYDMRTGHPGDNVIDQYTATFAYPQSATASSHPFAIEMPLAPEFDLLPPSPGINVALVLGLCQDAGPGDTLHTGQTLADAGPTLQAGANILLPLDEYHDPLPLDAMQGPRLTVPEAHRTIAPDGQVLWYVTVEGPDDSYDAQIFGVNAADARLHVNRVDPGGQIPVSIAVPETAGPGDVLEVILSVAPRDRPLAANAIRLTAEVTLGGSDDSAAISALGNTGKASPGPSIALGLMVLIGLALRPLARLQR